MLGLFFLRVYRCLLVAGAVPALAGDHLSIPVPQSLQYEQKVAVRVESAARL